MSARRLNLILLGLNFGFAAVILYLAWPRTAPDPRAANLVTWTNVITNTQISVRKINATNFLSALLNRPFHWSTLESTNYVEFIGRLLAFGCPEETVVDIIVADIAEHYATRRAALRAQLPPLNYWQPPDVAAAASPARQEVLAQLEALDAEQRALVQDLLEVDYDAVIAKFSTGRDLEALPLDFLDLEAGQPPEVRALWQHYRALEAAVIGDRSGALSPLDAATLRELEKQRDAELAKLLTPEQLFEFQVRHSATARALQTQLATFKPSEQEFRTVFELQSALTNTLHQRFDPDEARNEQIRDLVVAEAQRAFHEELQKNLGGERYTNYVRSQDADYRTLAQMADRFDWSPDKASRVYEMKQSVEARRQQLLANPDLPDEKRQAALAEIRAESQKAVEELLGTNGYFAYRQLAGDWIAEMPEPVATPEPTPPPFPVFEEPPLPPMGPAGMPLFSPPLPVPVPPPAGQ